MYYDVMLYVAFSDLEQTLQLMISCLYIELYRDLNIFTVAAPPLIDINYNRQFSEYQQCTMAGSTHIWSFKSNMGS